MDAREELGSGETRPAGGERRRGRLGFVKLVLILFGTLLIALWVLPNLLGSGDGSLPFDYDGFG